MTQDRAISSESTLTAGDEGDVAYESQSLTLNLIRGVCAGCAWENQFQWQVILLYRYMKAYP